MHMSHYTFETWPNWDTISAIEFRNEHERHILYGCKSDTRVGQGLLKVVLKVTIRYKFHRVLVTYVPPLLSYLQYSLILNTQS